MIISPLVNDLAKQTSGTARAIADELRVFAAVGTGFERDLFPPGNSHIERPGSAKCSALLPDSIMAHDERLAEVISAWPELPAALKSVILAMVRAG